MFTRLCVSVDLAWKRLRSRKRWEVSMYDVRELMPGIHQIHCQGEDRYGLGDGRTVMYAAWFLAGPPAAIIEPGPTSVAEVLLQAIRDLGYDPQAVEMVAATHIHVDHAGGLGYLARELPRARFAVHHRGVRHMADPARLVASTTATFDPHWEEVFGPIDAVPADTCWAPPKARATRQWPASSDTLETSSARCAAATGAWSAFAG